MKHAIHLLFGLVAFAALVTTAQAQNPPADRTAATESVQHLQGYQIVELRRYVTKEGERAHFAAYFDTYFPEAFEQLGAMVFGQFLERSHPGRFTWLRGFKDSSARAIVNAAFYYGPLWKEHRTKVNAILPDSDNVLLLRPLRPEHGIPVLPAVDPVAEANGAQGVGVAQIFAIQQGREEAFAKQAEAVFARYRIPGVHAAGVMVSLDGPNTFPQLPIRADGPFLVWLGVVKDDATLKARFMPILKAAEQSLAATGLLRGEPERVVMNPTPRSRLRWLSGDAESKP